MTVSWKLLVLTFAFVLFVIAAYLSTDLASKLTRAAFALIALAWIL